MTPKVDTDIINIEIQDIEGIGPITAYKLKDAGIAVTVVVVGGHYQVWRYGLVLVLHSHITSVEGRWMIVSVWYIHGQKFLSRSEYNRHRSTHLQIHLDKWGATDNSAYSSVI